MVTLVYLTKLKMIVTFIDFCKKVTEDMTVSGTAIEEVEVQGYPNAVFSEVNVN